MATASEYRSAAVHGPGRVGIALLVLLTIGLAAQGVLLFDPVSGLLDGRPILTNDFSILTYQCETAQRFFAKDRTIWGYDPYFMAGYPLDFVWNSNVFLQLLSLVSLPGSSASVLKAFVLFCSMIAPLLLYCTCRNFSLSVRASLIGAALGCTYFRAGLLVMYLAVGMVTACLVSLMSLYTLSLVHRAVNENSWRPWALLFLCTPVVFLIHKTALVTVAFPVALYVVFHSHTMTPKKMLAFVALALAVCLANSFWLVPFLTFVHYKTLLTDTLFWQNRDILRPLWDLVSIHQHIGQSVSRYKVGLLLTHDLLVVAGILGLVRWRRNSDTTRTRSYVIILAYFFLLSYYGSFLKILQSLDPSRYIPILYLLLIPPAARGIEAFWEGFIQQKPDAYRTKLWLWVVGVFLLLNLLPNLSWSVLGKGRLRTQHTPVEQNLLAWIKEATDTQARILIEDSGFFDRHSRGLVYASSYFPALVPLLTGRALIGGPYPYIFIKHHYASFRDGIFLERDIDTYSLEELKKAFDLYNIRWIVCWSSRAVRAFNAYPDYLVPKERFGKFNTYEVRRTPSYFISGSGRLAFDYNEIRLTDVHGGAHGDVIISFHWMETLYVDPAGRMEPLMLDRDPIPFIRIVDPPLNLTIRNGPCF